MVKHDAPDKTCAGRLDADSKGLEAFYENSAVHIRLLPVALHEHRR